MTAMCDANWGPQDTIVPKKNTNITLKLFKTRLISVLALWHYGPIHWVSKRQSITARSSAGSKIYVTDECTKVVQSLYQMVSKMGLEDTIMKTPTVIYNNDNACDCWAKNLTTKRLCHIQI
eukprot:10725217-Ditylum_brightwellii.AAC.1